MHWKWQNPIQLKYQFFTVSKTRYHNFWDKKDTDKRIDEGKKCFHFFSFFYWFLFSFSFDLWSFSSFFRLSSQQTKDKYPRSYLSLIINNIILDALQGIQAIIPFISNFPYFLHSKKSFNLINHSFISTAGNLMRRN